MEREPLICYWFMGHCGVCHNKIIDTATLDGFPILFILRSLFYMSAPSIRTSAAISTECIKLHKSWQETTRPCCYLKRISVSRWKGWSRWHRWAAGWYLVDFLWLKPYPVPSWCKKPPNRGDAGVLSKMSRSIKSSGSHRCRRSQVRKGKFHSLRPFQPLSYEQIKISPPVLDTVGSHASSFVCLLGSYKLLLVKCSHNGVPRPPRLGTKQTKGLFALACTRSCDEA